MFHLQRGKWHRGNMAAFWFGDLWFDSILWLHMKKKIYGIIDLVIDKFHQSKMIDTKNEYLKNKPFYINKI